MSCPCQAPRGVGAIHDLPSASLMPRYAPAAGFGALSDMSTGTVIAATLGWLAVGGLCGAALFVAGKEFLKS